MKEYILFLKDMSCSHCGMKISNALKEIEITDFKISLPEKKVIVRTESIELILKKLEEIEYHAEIV